MPTSFISEWPSLNETASSMTSSKELELVNQVGESLGSRNPQRSEKPVTTGTKAGALEPLAPVDMSVTSAAGSMSRVRASRRVDEPMASHSLTSRIWRAACSFVEEEYDERGEEGEVDEVEDEGAVEAYSFLPRYLRGFGWRKPMSKGSRTASYTEIDGPLPCPPAEEYKHTAMKTIHDNPSPFPRFDTRQYRPTCEHAQYSSKPSFCRIGTPRTPYRPLAMG
ncbi:hypothetical protein BDZ89DRAFT_1143361 [Hymenopellis radicata]|nr:hypothetical protein BDZ89DRAFT_1143361 [Hymenopellis radicata]